MPERSWSGTAVFDIGVISGNLSTIKQFQSIFGCIHLSWDVSDAGRRVPIGELACRALGDTARSNGFRTQGYFSLKRRLVSLVLSDVSCRFDLALCDTMRTDEEINSGSAFGVHGVCDYRTGHIQNAQVWLSNIYDETCR